MQQKQNGRFLACDGPELKESAAWREKRRTVVGLTNQPLVSLSSLSLSLSNHQPSMVLSPFQGSAEAPVMVNAKSPSPPSLTNEQSNQLAHHHLSAHHSRWSSVF